MKQTLNTEHSMLKVELIFSELDVGRWAWTLDVSDFVHA
jgi:hypothetical protein